jgi:ketosteroid isomerase-like protein
MGSVFRDWLSAWDDWTAKAEEYRELDSGRVLVVTTSRGRGKSSGLGVGQMYAHGANLFHVRNAKVTRLVTYWNRDRALADLGLPAEPATLTPAEKLALAQRSYAAFNAGPDIDALLPLYHPECDWRTGPMGAAFGTESLRGHGGLRALVAAIEEAWDNFAVEIDEARITGEDVALTRAHARGRSRGTNIEIPVAPFWQRTTYRDGLILSVEQFEFDEPPPEWDEATPITPEAG